MIIAKTIPDVPASGKKSEVAAAYGLSVEELSRQMYAFLQGEGCDDGGEYETLHDWLTLPHGTAKDNTPWQKGDDQID